MSKIRVEIDVADKIRPILTIHNHTHEEVVRSLSDVPETLREAVLRLFRVVDEVVEANNGS